MERGRTPSGVLGVQSRGFLRRVGSRPGSRRLPDVPASVEEPVGPWVTPIANDPVRAIVRVPGSKSETNRALVLAALAGLLACAVPRLAVLAWVPLVLVTVVMLFGQVLRLPQWFQDLRNQLNF